MKTEKGLAFAVIIFNFLTNILMLVPSVLFAFMLMDGAYEYLPFIIIGYIAIVYSYFFSVYFFQTWIFRKNETNRRTTAWGLAIIHYSAFLLYMLLLFLGVKDLNPSVEAYLGLTPILIPLILSVLGKLANEDEIFWEERKERKSDKESTDDTKDIKLKDDSLSQNIKLSTMQNNDSSNSTFGRFSQWLKESIVVKLMAIGFLVLILLIPNAMISDLIYERQARQGEVTREVSKSWGGFQSVTGPVLSIPYSTWTNYKDGRKTENKHVAYFLPKILNIDGELPHQIRERSIFKVILYQAELKLSGEFETPDFEALHVAAEDIHWEQAKLSVGISGMTGIKEIVEIDWNGNKGQMEPGTASSALLKSGVSAPVSTASDISKYSFSIPIKLNGSGGICFEPVGKSTKVEINSTWHSPSFTGNFLPDERTVSQEGFSAKWQVLDLNRNYPQMWKDDEINFSQVNDLADYNYRYTAVDGTPNDGATLAVRLVQPVNEYSKNNRSAKYAILVIGLTFILYLFFEVLQKLLIHPFQYLLVGLAITVFYLLLLSLSEHFGFNLAYIVSATATILLITGYSWSILGIKRLVFQLGGLLVAIYGFIFVLLQLEDYALLAGSVGVFLTLAMVMYSSRKVDWYDLGKRN